MTYTNIKVTMLELWTPYLLLDAIESERQIASVQTYIPKIKFNANRKAADTILFGP